MSSDERLRGFRIERIIREGVAALLLFGTVLLLGVRYSALSRMISSPFNGGGDANGMADKSQLWLVVFIQGFLYGLMSLFNLFPDIGPTSTAAKENSLPPMMIARMAMGWIKVVVMALALFWMLSLVS